MVKSDLKKSLPFKNYSKNSEWPSRKFLIKMAIFVLQRYVCYEYWAMCYEVFLTQDPNLMRSHLKISLKSFKNLLTIHAEDMKLIVDAILRRSH